MRSGILFLLYSLRQTLTIMEPALGKNPHDSSQGSPLLQPSPVRILVQTLTHLVPSGDITRYTDPYMAKYHSMFDHICKHHWNRKFDPTIHRDYTYNDNLGYNDRLCFYLLDYGTTSNDDDVPILCYEWTGESLYDNIHHSYPTQITIINILL